MNSGTTPLAYLRTAGPAADPLTRLGWGLAFIAIAVIVIIAALLIAAIFRKRSGTPRGAWDRALIAGQPHDGLMWIYLGTGISAVVLFAAAVWTLVTLAAVAAPASAPRIIVDVRSYQFWWRVRYIDSHGKVLVTTANEIHIPLGEPVRLQLSSGDVIHSFWVPQLAGKMDAIPGQTNITWLQADRAGRYRGQCGEYCGAQHAHMAFFVVAEAPEQFAQWLAHQQTRARAGNAAVSQGEQLFVDKCGGCHAVGGTAAGGRLAPDLTHLMTRQTIAAGTLPNTPAMLARWIAHPDVVKPGSAMPVVPLTPVELESMVRYLETLR